MPSVPDTNTFTLQDVVAVVGGASLSSSFANSVDAYFDAAYKGSKDRLSNFRNYQIPSDAITILNVEYGVPDMDHWRVTYQINSLGGFLYNVIGVCWVFSIPGTPTISDSVAAHSNSGGGYGVGTYTDDMYNPEWSAASIRAFARTTDSSSVVYSLTEESAP